MLPLKPHRLRPGDRVRFVSPAITPDWKQVGRGAKIRTGWDLDMEIGEHAFDTMGLYLAGRDEDWLSDIKASLRDLEAARRDLKPLVGFSDVTILHSALWQKCRVAGFHGLHVDWPI